MSAALRLLGLDPGLQRTGWGLVEANGTRLRHIANGVITTNARQPLADRLVQLHDGLSAVLAEHQPHSVAVEETFVNANPTSTLKLGQARGVVMLAGALAGLPVAEYTPNHVKKSVVGVGHAAKAQIDAMVRTLLPGVTLAGADAADALAVAICHAHHQSHARALAASGGGH